MKAIGIVLIVFGVLALVLGGFSLLNPERVLEAGPFRAASEARITVPITPFPIVPVGGIAVLIGGAALVVAAPKARLR
jgi:hypothetical protein